MPIARNALIAGAVLALMVLLWPIVFTREQLISGTLLEDGEPVVGHALRFGTDERSVACLASFVETTTAEDGSFSFSQDYSEKFIENFTVLVHSYTLCERRDEVWKGIWSARTGPAPRSIRLACSVTIDAYRSIECEGELD